jgi:hypothetical protein
MKKLVLTLLALAVATTVVHAGFTMSSGMTIDRTNMYMGGYLADIRSSPNGTDMLTCRAYAVPGTTYMDCYGCDASGCVYCWSDDRTMAESVGVIDGSSGGMGVYYDAADHCTMIITQKSSVEALKKP